MKCNRGLRASQQGHLDCLCGIYSLVNALAYLYDGRIKRKHLINLLLRQYKYRYDIYDLISSGLDDDEMDYLIQSTLQQGYYLKHYPIIIKKPYQYKIKLRTKNIIKDIFTFINDKNNLYQRVILFGTQEHWSIITGADNKYFYFFDSCGNIKAQHKSFSLIPKKTRHTLFPSAIYFIERLF